VSRERARRTNLLVEIKAEGGARRRTAGHREARCHRRGLDRRAVVEAQRLTSGRASTRWSNNAG
jgi:hypothetical protein